MTSNSVNSKRIISNPDMIGRYVKMSKMQQQEEVSSDGFNSTADALNTLNLSSEKNSDTNSSPSSPILGRILPTESVFDGLMVRSVAGMLEDDSQQWVQKDLSDAGSVDRALDEEESQISRIISVESSSSQKPVGEKISVSSFSRRPSHNGGFKRNKSESTVGSASGHGGRSDYGWFDDVHEVGKDDSFPRKRYDHSNSNKFPLGVSSHDGKNKMLFQELNEGDMNEVYKKCKLMNCLNEFHSCFEAWDHNFTDISLITFLFRCARRRINGSNRTHLYPRRIAIVSVVMEAHSWHSPSTTS